MTGWRSRLAAIRARHADADSAESADSCTAGANGTSGTNDNGMETPNGVAAPPAAPVSPPGLAYLPGLAARLDAALRAGAAVARCPSGALDITLPDGRLWLLSPHSVARLAAGGMLPAPLAGCGLAAGTYQPGDPDPLRDGLLRGWRTTRHRRKPPD